MWEEDWARLGIEPTTDLAAIKKAYALKLKVTRPDDDAEAYQALRGAYERAQNWVKWQQQQAAQLAEAEFVAAPAPVADTAAPAPVEAPAAVEPPPVETLVRPDQLIHELTLRWRHSGEPALLHAWATEVRPELDQQPLSRHVEFSAAFAQWVLATPALPDDLLRALNAHFGWLGDFRTERLLGTELAQALHQVLEERLRPRPMDPAVRELGEPLLRLESLRHARGEWLLRQWLCLLLQPLLARSQAMLGGQWLRALGLEPEAQAWLRHMLKRTLWLRVGLATLAFLGGAIALFRDPVVAAAHALLWLGLTALVLVLGLAGGRLLGAQLEAMAPAGRRWTLRRPAWLRDINGAALGPVWLLFAAWLFYLDARTGIGAARLLPAFMPDDVVTYAGWVFALGGVVLARPRHGPGPYIVMGLSPLVTYFAVHALDTWLPLQSCAAVGAAWLLAGAALHDQRLGHPALAPAQWLLRPMLNTLALAERWTYGVAMTPVAAVLAYATLADGEVRPLRVFGCWVLAILAVGWLQNKAEALGLRQLPALTER